MMNKFEMCENCKERFKENISYEYDRSGWYDPNKILPKEGQCVRFEPLLYGGLGRSMAQKSYKGTYENGKFKAIVWRLRRSMLIEYFQLEQGEPTKGYQKQELSKSPRLIYRWIACDQ